MVPWKHIFDDGKSLHEYVLLHNKQSNEDQPGQETPEHKHIEIPLFADLIQPVGHCTLLKSSLRLDVLNTS